MEIGAKIKIYIKNEIKYDICGFDVFIIKNNDYENPDKKSFENGKIEMEDLIPNKYTFKLKQNTSKNKDESYSEEPGKNMKVNVVQYQDSSIKEYSIDLENSNYIVITENKNGVSN